MSEFQNESSSASKEALASHFNFHFEDNLNFNSANALDAAVSGLPKQIQNTIFEFKKLSDKILTQNKTSKENLRNG